MSPRTDNLAQFGIRSFAVIWIAYVLWYAREVFGLDYMTYRLVGERILAGGPVYTAAQLAGPHLVQAGDNLYPPTSLPLFMAFALIPSYVAVALWYAIPLTIVVAFLRHARPSGWRLTTIMAVMAWPVSVQVLWLGNPVIWSLAALCLGLRYGWPVAFVVLKPVMAPLALLGARDWRTWAILAGFAFAALATLTLTLDWFRVMLNGRGPFANLGFLLGNVPLMFVPLIAGRTKPAPAEARAGVRGALRA